VLFWLKQLEISKEVEESQPLRKRKLTNTWPTKNYLKRKLSRSYSKDIDENFNELLFDLVDRLKWISSEKISLGIGKTERTIYKVTKIGNSINSKIMILIENDDNFLELDAFREIRNFKNSILSNL